MKGINEILAKKIVALRPSNIWKFFDIVRTMEGAISLSVSESDSNTSWPTREEGIYSLERRHTFYTSNAGLDELREEIARYIRRRFSVSYGLLSETTMTVGSLEGIDLACRVMLDSGDEVIVLQPNYASYKSCVRLVGGVPVIVELKEKDRFKLMPKDLEGVATPRTRFLALPSPNNLTGSIMAGEEPMVIAEIAIRYDLYVVSDEIYTELTYNGEVLASIIQIPGMRKRTVLINGFSKAYVMTGWRLGYACGSEPILHQMIKVYQYAITCAPTTSQYAVVTALRDCSAEIAQMREIYNQRRRYLLKRLEEMNTPCFEPEGTFYIFLNISKFGMSFEEFCAKLLAEEKVVAVPGMAFGQSGEGFARILYTCSLEQPREVMGCVQRFVKRYAN